MAVLSERQIKKTLQETTASGGRKELGDGRVQGLTLRVSGKTATWTLTYRMPGDSARKRTVLGRYPAIGVTEARDLAAGHWRNIAKGIDPVQAAIDAVDQIKAEVEAERNRLTFSAMLERFLDAKAKLRWARHYRGILERSVIKPKDKRLQGLGQKAAEDVTRSDIKTIIKAKIDDGHQTQARRTYEVLRTAFNWALDNDLLVTSPVHKQDKPDQPEARDRVLSIEEIRALWFALDHADNANFRSILRLQLLLAQRSGEIAGMARSEIKENGMVWEIPARRCKNGRKHRVPLPPMARQIISEAKAQSQSDRYVFPAAARVTNKRGDASRTLVATTSDVVANYVSKLQRVLSFKDADGQPARFVAHDLRRTVATRLEEMGTPRPVIAALLNHVSETKSGVTAQHYVMSELEPDVREALTKWQKAIEVILSGDDPFAHRKADIEAMERDILGGDRKPSLRLLQGGAA